MSKVVCSDVTLKDGTVVRARHTKGKPPTERDLAILEEFAKQLQAMGDSSSGSC